MNEVLRAIIHKYAEDIQGLTNEQRMQVRGAMEKIAYYVKLRTKEMCDGNNLRGR